MTTFKRRLLDITFVLGEGAFGRSGQNTTKLSNLRVSTKIIKAGGHAMGTLDAVIYGMTLSSMNKLSTLGLVPLTYRRNTITVAAGFEGGAMSTVFQGQIIDAYIDTQSAPEVAFRVTANTGTFDAVAPIEPSSYPNPVAVADVLSGLATQMGLRFENNGVEVMLPPTYLYGTARVQAQMAVDHAGIEWNGGDDAGSAGEDFKGILAIWPRGGSRGGAVPLVSPTTGMIGYPAFSPTGIIVRTLFNPSISMGGQIEVKSSQQAVLDRANAAQKKEQRSKWVVNIIDHDLESQTPDGQWFSTINASPLGFGVPVR